MAGETGQALEIPQIPKNWNFPEKGLINFKVVQADFGAHFLALKEDDGYRVERFFAKSKDSDDYYSTDYRKDTPGSADTDKPNRIEVCLKTEFGHVSFDLLHSGYTLAVKVYLGDGDYAHESRYESHPGSGKFLFVRKGDLFELANATMHINGSHPRIWIKPQVGDYVQDEPDSYETTGGGKFTRKPSSGDSHEVTYVENGNEATEFKYGWKMQNGQLNLSETELKTGEKSELKVPISIPIKDFDGILTVTAPYESKVGNTGKTLQAPWKDLARIWTPNDPKLIS